MDEYFLVPKFQTRDDNFEKQALETIEDKFCPSGEELKEIEEERFLFMHRKMALIRFRVHLIQDMRQWVVSSDGIHKQIVE